MIYNQCHEFHFPVINTLSWADPSSSLLMEVCIYQINVVVFLNHVYFINTVKKNDKRFNRVYKGSSSKSLLLQFYRYQN